MGMGGCLGPQKLKQEVYVSLISEIHIEAKKITASQNLDLYIAIKQKLSKKGYLRKLSDNLASHRNKITEALNYNFKIVISNKEIENLYAGLVVADSIVDIVYHKKQDICQPKIEDSSNDSHSFVSNKHKKSHSKSKSKQFKENFDLPNQVNSGIDEQYLKLINYQFDRQSRIHPRLLESLKIFCTNHDGIIDCEHEVWKIINRLVVNIKKNQMLEESCEDFSLLLDKTKDRTTEQLRNSQTLEKIIKLWLQNQKNSPSSSLQKNCEQIIKINFSRCISSWDSQILYEAMFKIYDDIQFRQDEEVLLNGLYLETLRDLDLRNNFLRGLVNYMFGYLSTTKEMYADKKWFAVSLGLNYQSMRSLYKNVFKDSVKIAGFNVLNKWIQNQYVDINQITLYHSKAIIFTFSANVRAASQNKATADQILDLFITFVKKMSEENQQLLKNRIIEEFKEENLVKEEREVLLKLIKQMIMKGDGKGKVKNMENFFIPINLSYNRELKFEIIRLVGFILQSTEGQQLSLTNFEKYKICEFLYSIYENIGFVVETLPEKYQFTCAAISFFRLAAVKFDKCLLISYIQHVDKILNDKSENFPQDAEFCLIYLIFEIRSLVFTGVKTPEALVRISKKITPQASSDQLQDKIEKYLQHRDHLELDKVYNLLDKFNKGEYNELNFIFSQFFIEKKKKMQEQQIPQQMSSSQRINPFNRRSSLQSDKVLETRSQDKSFEEVLDILQD